MRSAAGAGTPAQSRIPDVIVVGAGIAGIACAIRLAERGVGVTLLETRKKLGGRATSFTDPRSGEVLDNCQHVVLGCCTNYMDLLARLGSDHHIRWTREQYWIEEGGRTSIVRPSVWSPAPVHFGASFLRAKFLSMTEAASIGRACIRMLAVDRRHEQDRTFAAWLRDQGQSDRVMRRFWSPVIVSACNLDLDRVAASSALHVFQEGFLANHRAADIGVSSVPLADLYTHVGDVIERGGGRVLTGAGVSRLDARSVTLTDGQTLSAGAVVCAVPVERVARTVTPETRADDPRFEVLDRFEHSPILGVHMRFERDVMGDMPHAVLVERPTQWIFRKSEDGRSIHAVISAADSWIALSEDQIADRVRADLTACLRSMSREPAPRLERIRVVKEKLATFAPVPGLDALRPEAIGPHGLNGVLLAGDYTRTGWPATMEGATRSGYAAASAILADSPESSVVSGLDIAPLSRWLGLTG